MIFRQARAARSCSLATLRRGTIWGTIWLLIIVAVPPVEAGRGRADKCISSGWKKASGGWTMIQGSLRIDSFAVHPFDTSRLYLSDGSTLLRSTNGGCSWETSIRLYNERAASSTDFLFVPRIKTILFPEARKSRLPLYLLVDDAYTNSAINVGPSERAPLGRPVVMASGDGGKNWDRHVEGLPTLGHPVAMAISSSDHKKMYMIVAIGTYIVVGQAGQEISAERPALYASDDAGQSWSLVNEEIVPPPLTVYSLVVDSVNPDDLWLATHKGLYSSSDGGQSWIRTDAIGPEPVQAVDVFHRNGTDARIAAFKGGSMFWSADGGKHWLKKKADAFYTVQSVAHGAAATDLVVSSETQVLRYDLRENSWYDITPNLDDELARQDLYCDVTSDRTRHPAFYVCTPTTLLRYSGRI